MDILQAPQRQFLQEKLRKLGGGVTFFPRLASEDSSLNAQPSRAALERNLATRKAITLEGIAGSGKSVLCLALVLESNAVDCAYLEASAWAPSASSTNRLDEFLLRAGCDYVRAKAAMDQGRLVLVLDAIDEAPWTTSASSAVEALVQLSAEINNKAGLLVTSRTSRQVPTLQTACVVAALGGIRPSDVEPFLAKYAGSRSQVGTVAERLRSLKFPEQLKYSPLVLRLFAEGLSSEKLPTNPMELFEAMADFLIQRECKKPLDARQQPRAGSWQQRYSQENLHRSVVSALVFGSGRSGRAMSEAEFENLTNSILQPDNLDARALVSVSTLMSQHPLVIVTYRGPEAVGGEYAIECPHDWARTGLFPKFLSSDLLVAQVEVLDRWHEALPHWQDYVSSWEWLAEAGRAEENLRSLVDLSGTAEQGRTVARWLGAQVFSGRVTGSVCSDLFSALALLIGKFTAGQSNLTEVLDLTSLVTEGLVLRKQSLRLDNRSQVVNFSDLVIEECTLIVNDNGPLDICLRNSMLNGVSLRILNNCDVRLVDCLLVDCNADIPGNGRLILQHCVCDQKSCSFPPQRTTGLDTCQAAKVKEHAFHAWLLREILRRLIIVTAGDHLELTKKRTNIAEENLISGPVALHKGAAQRILGVMQTGGYIVFKPTGSRWRVDPTKKFEAYEAARYVQTATLGGVGPMTEYILRALNR